jgi:histidinol-phosphate aminotransferase
MEAPLNVIKESVRELRPYTLRPDRARIKINQNENPWDVPEAIKAETQRRLNARPWSRYPDFNPQGLRERLAEFTAWKPDGIVAGNGSNELIQALFMITVAKGTCVLISEPTFALYRQLTTVLGGEVISVPLTAELTYDIPALQDAIQSESPAVTIICSPNNPTGGLIDCEGLISLLESSHGLVVIDEAYHEFSGQTCVPLLKKYSNLVVLHTFSKAMAMAGLRIGYALAPPELAREIAKAVLPYNLNVISATAAEVAIAMFASQLKPLVTRICAERDRLYLELKRIRGLEPVASQANFMIVRSTVDPRRVFNELLQRDILIRDVSSYPMLRDYFRVSVGTPEENERLLAALREIFSTAQKSKDDL